MVSSPGVLLPMILTKWRHLHPVYKGMASYAILWPTGSLIQQTIEGKTLYTYDWWRALRFSLFGGLYVAPTLYCWVRLSSVMWPQMSLRTGLTKALVEQFSYGPFACASFFMGMSLLECKTLEDAVKETQQKFLPTFKVGACIWPVLQTINFSLVPEPNRVIYVSICSLIWTTFLAFMKRREVNDMSKSNGFK